MRIAVACGGTGGHIFPGLAVAKELLHRGHDVTLWLAGRDVESSSVEGWGGPVIQLPAKGIQGRFISKLFNLAQMPKTVLAAHKKMRADRPDVVLAMGSYASVGPGLAAKWLKIPLVLHEGNAVQGRAIRCLSLLAAKIGTGFPDVRFPFAQKKTMYCGFPLRKEFTGFEREQPKVPQLLITGGSQGARILNRTVPGAIRRYLDQGGSALQVVHLSGQREYNEVVKAYQGLEDMVRVEAFSHDMLSLYRNSSFAITRAGAATCTELAVSRLPALLIPLASAAGNHQWHNAQWMAREGGFRVMAQDDCNPDAVAKVLLDVFQNKDSLTKMEAVLPGAVVSDATQRLAHLVESVKRGQ